MTENKKEAFDIQLPKSYFTFEEIMVKLIVPSVTLRRWGRRNEVLYIRKGRRIYFEANSVYLQKRAKDILSLKTMLDRSTKCTLCGNSPTIYYYTNKDLLPEPLCFQHYFEHYIKILNGLQ